MHAHRKLKTLAPMVILALGKVSTTDTKRVMGFLLYSCVNSILTPVLTLLLSKE